MLPAGHVGGHIAGRRWVVRRGEPDATVNTAAAAAVAVRAPSQFIHVICGCETNEGACSEPDTKDYPVKWGDWANTDNINVA